jgi:hypothetical protein
MIANAILELLQRMSGFREETSGSAQQSHPNGREALLP